MSRVATVSVSSSPIPAYILGGTWDSMIIATDTADVSTIGYITVFNEDTVLLEIPVAGGVVPNHTVFARGTLFD